MLDRLMSEFRIDTNRVYVYGRVGGRACGLGFDRDAARFLRRCLTPSRLEWSHTTPFRRGSAALGLVRSG